MSAPAAAIPHAPEPGFGIYLHWPFCRAKCPYCDFNSHVREAIDERRWRRALLSELDHYASKTAGRLVTSLFFGGGTPSLMSAETVSAIIARVGEHWPLGPDLEITLEANPTSVEADRFAGFRAAGVNRVSVGLQSLDDRALAFLGRQHSAAEALAAVALAKRHFPRVSCDLIYALPGQSAADWRAQIAIALDLGVEHFSLYQLTIEAGTAFHGARRRGELTLPGEAAGATLYQITQDALGAAGLAAYEISNHARPGAACRHNLTYWRYGDYLGIGPGAHGRLTIDGQKRALRQHRAPESWLQMVESEGHATKTQTPLSPDERLDEMVMMGLRLDEGIARQAFHRELGAEPERLLAPAALAKLCREGYLEIDARALRATAAGRRRLDALLGYLLGAREAPAA